MSEKTANIKTLYANQEKTEILFPRTKIEAISDNKGTSLKAYLNDAVYAADVDTDIGSTSSPVEADTLGGETPEFYASKNYVDGMKNAIDTNLANNYLDKETIEKIYAPKSYVDDKIVEIIGGGEIVLDGYVTDQKLQNEVQTLQESINNVNAKAEAAATPEDVLEAKTNAINEAWSYTNQQVKKATPRNLLDNSDFRNPVNQRGQTSYNTTEICSIDRWFSPAPNTITVNADSINVSDNYFVQRVEAKKLTGSKYTIGFMAKTGLLMGCVDISNVAVGGDLLAYASGAHVVRLYRESENLWQCYILCGLSTDLLYAFMYEGEYTAETLPEYQPKGYAAEYAECRRYFRRHSVVIPPYSKGNDPYVFLGLDTDMYGTKRDVTIGGIAPGDNIDYDYGGFEPYFSDDRKTLSCILVSNPCWSEVVYVKNLIISADL